MNLRLVATLLAALSCCAAGGDLPPARAPAPAAIEPARVAALDLEAPRLPPG